MFTSSPHLLLSCFYRWSLASWKTWSLLRSAVGKAPVSKDIIQPHVHVSGAGLNAEASELLLFHVSCLYGDQRGIRGKKRGIHSDQESLFPRKKKICASLYCIQINESWSECYNKNKLAKLTQMFTFKTKKICKPLHLSHSCHNLFHKKWTAGRCCNFLKRKKKKKNFQNVHINWNGGN